MAVFRHLFVIELNYALLVVYDPLQSFERIDRSASQTPRAYSRAWLRFDTQFDGCDGRPLQIVTNSLPVANLFSSCDSVDLVPLGGAIHHRTGVTLGNFANQMLQSVTVQKAFLSVAGVNARGFYNSNMLLVETERAMMQCADRTIIVADSSKFGHCSLARLCELSDVHTLVADDEWNEPWRTRVEESNVQLILASSAASQQEDASECSTENQTSTSELSS